MDRYTETMRTAFREEAGELLTELETALLELESTPEEPELVDKVFRAMHTIKGSGAMFGFQAISEFTHQVETVFDLVRKGELSVSRELIDLTLLARDQIREMLDAPPDQDSVQSVRATELVTMLHRLTGGGPGAQEQPQGGSAAAPGSSGAPLTLRIRFKPARDIFLHGTNPVLLLEELRELGECMVVAHAAEVPALQEIEPEECYTYWDVILTTTRGVNAVRDVFIFVEDDSELRIEVIDEGEPVSAEGYKRLGEILVERGDISPKKLEEVLANRQLLGKMLMEAGLVSPERVQAALVEQRQVKEARQRRQQEEASATIRVRSEKLDTLVDLVGELVTVQARLSQLSGAEAANARLLAIAEEVERLTAELRDNAMSLRMVPIGTTFSRFRRLVRDLSAQLGKEITLVTEGAETELDKTVIERLGDPLVHLIRNCIDHGIEQPDRRRAGGKPAAGTIRLAAAHSGGYVLIRIEDDGAGLDKERIRARAVERGLASPDAELSEKELYQLIFAPGFSTAERVTGVSGRGVGMDVVRRTLDGLGGTVEVDSRPAEGTTITLKIPLTLAIIEGLLVRIGADHFVFPLAAVDQCVELSREDVAAAHGRNLVNVRGKLLPYVNLRSMFSIEGEPPEIQQVVTAQWEAQLVGFSVDAVIGQIQTVIKTLGKMYRNVEGISGATILGDGGVALILDIARLAQKAEAEEQDGIGSRA